MALDVAVLVLSSRELDECESEYRWNHSYCFAYGNDDLAEEMEELLRCLDPILILDHDYPRRMQSMVMNAHSFPFGRDELHNFEPASPMGNSVFFSHFMNEIVF